MAMPEANYAYGLGTVQRYSQHFRPSWCDVLGVGPEATRDEIRKAYHDAAKVAHPDHGGSKDRMTALNIAYASAMGT